MRYNDSLDDNWSDFSVCKGLKCYQICLRCFKFNLTMEMVEQELISAMYLGLNMLRSILSKHMSDINAQAPEVTEGASSEGICLISEDAFTEG